MQKCSQDHAKPESCEPPYRVEINYSYDYTDVVDDRWDGVYEKATVDLGDARKKIWKTEKDRGEEEYPG